MNHPQRPHGGRPAMPVVVPGDFLVAAAGTHDENFDQSVVLIVDADDDGALGVVLNRMTTMDMDTLLPQWRPLVSAPAALFSGGPVSPDGALCLAALDTGLDEPMGWRRIHGDVGLLQLDTPVELAECRYRDMRIFAGYAGWAAGQLENELSTGQWYVVAGSTSDVFSPQPANLWRAVLRRSGSDMALFSTWTPDSDLN